MRVALATSFDGSITCGAPRSWTHTSASGKRRTTKPVAPAWSRWMWVSRIRRTSTSPSAANSPSTDEAGPGSTMTPSSGSWQQMTRGVPRWWTSSSRTLGHHDVEKVGRVVEAAPRARPDVELARERRGEPAGVIGDGLVGVLLGDDRHVLRRVEERERRAAGGDRGARLLVEDEERGEQAAAGLQEARGLGQVVRGLLLEEMREDGR